MNICTNCGVELEKDIINCPLCGKNIGETETEAKSDNTVHYPSDIIMLHKKETRRHLWELSGVIAFSSVTVCSIVNLVISRNLTWSLFANTSVLSAWIYLTLILLAYRKYFILIPGFLITTLSILFLFDLILPPVNWFFRIGLPITIVFYASASIVILLWKVAHLKGFNILAISFLIFSVFCIITEVIIDLFLTKKADIHWSAIVAVSILPIAFVLLFMHYRMKKGKRLDSYFHI